MKRLNKPLMVIAIAAAVWSCSGGSSIDKQHDTDSNAVMTLLEWFAANGNYINSEAIPSIMDAEVIYALQKENILVIDLRPEEQFDAGHVRHAVNVRPPAIMDYFVNRIDPTAFQYIFITCNNGNASGHVSAVLQLMGYSNVYAMRFGMSGWDREIAEKHWLANTGSHLEGKLDKSGNPKNQPGAYPELAVEATSGFAMMIERAEAVLTEKTTDYVITIEEFEKKPDANYTICYWPMDKYLNNGHLKGAVQYEPKKSLTHDSYLNTLPTDRPVVVYCYSGQHSAFVTAYLRMLGYDARNLAYGANAFIHETMARTEPRPTRTFTEKLIMNFPLESSSEKAPLLIPEVPSKETIVIQGGC